jgi:hypothetical protein
MVCGEEIRAVPGLVYRLVRVVRAFRACVRTPVVPTGLGSIPHFTQHYACGCVLG